MGAVEEFTAVFTALASMKSCSDSFFQVNENVFKTLETSVSDFKVTLVSGLSLWLCSVCVYVYVCVYI